MAEPVRHRDTGKSLPSFAERIDAFRGYVAADQREPRSPILNRTMTPRLPSWKTLARHRTMVLKSPDRLAATLDDPRAA